MPVLPDLFVTLHGIEVVGVDSRLKPITPGDTITVSAPAVITSAITPASGAGSVDSDLLLSAVRVAPLA